MNSDKITFEQLNDPAFRRGEQMKEKSEAVWVTFLELRDIIGITGFARTYFNKTHSWFSQKLNGNKVNGKPASFNQGEYAAISGGLRDLARRLNEYADAIDSAEISATHD